MNKFLLRHGLRDQPDRHRPSWECDDSAICLGIPDGDIGVLLPNDVQVKQNDPAADDSDLLLGHPKKANH